MRYTATIDLSSDVDVQKLEAFFLRGDAGGKIKVHGAWLKPRMIVQAGSVKRAVIEAMELNVTGKGLPKSISSAQLTRRIPDAHRNSISRILRTMFEEEEATRVWDQKYRIHRYTLTPLARINLDALDQARKQAPEFASMIWDDVFSAVEVGTELMLEDVMEQSGLSKVEARLALTHLAQEDKVLRVFPNENGLEYTQYFKAGESTGGLTEG